MCYGRSNEIRRSREQCTIWLKLCIKMLMILGIVTLIASSKCDLEMAGYYGQGIFLCFYGPRGIWGQ